MIRLERFRSALSVFVSGPHPFGRPHPLNPLLPWEKGKTVFSPVFAFAQTLRISEKIA